MKLYELANDYQEVLSLKDEMTEDQKKELIDVIQKEVENKADSLVFVNQNFKLEIEKIEKEIDRLKNRKESLEKSHERFKNYLLLCMNKMGVDKIKNTFGTIFLKETTSVQFTPNIDLTKLPKEFTKTSLSANKTELKKALANGEVIDGVYLEKKQSVNFR